jgi:hypothetical protein
MPPANESTNLTSYGGPSMQGFQAVETLGAMTHNVYNVNQN